MNNHTKALSSKYKHYFSEQLEEQEKTSMVQLSRQENYADQLQALELNIYIFGFNDVSKSNFVSKDNTDKLNTIALQKKDPSDSFNDSDILTS